ncbi:MAG: DUF1194 domain-containing protein [Pirellulaceae bacterium]|nr:DUF1194 domain-containing protein [Pirellulaceae bacterium]
MRTGTNTIVSFAALLVAALGFGSPLAATEAVDLELVLAVDISRSISAEEAELQRQGYIAALADPLVIKAVTSGSLGRIALTYVEWAGFDYYRTVVDWSIIDGHDSAVDFVTQLVVAPVVSAQRTSISAAIENSVLLFEANDIQGARRIIDVSGDGANNYGRPVVEARNIAVAAGVTVNGLPILRDWRGAAAAKEDSNLDSVSDLDLYYQFCVIGGPGAFIIAARDFDSFADAIKRKLVLEIAGATTSRHPASARSHWHNRSYGRSTGTLQLCLTSAPLGQIEVFS